MKKIILSAVMLAVATFGYAQSEQTPVAGERNEWLPSFSSVDVRASLDITFILVPDTQAPKIVYDTKGSYTTKFKAEVKDKVLHITERADARRPERTSVTLYCNAVQKIAIADAVATFDGVINATMLDLTIGGQATVKAALDVKDLRMELTGRSSATLSGTARYLSLYVSTGKVDASALEVMSAQVNALSSGVASLWITDRFEGTTSTKGKINYKGSPLIVRGEPKFMGGEITHLP
ncbi:MAG: DUF2807 domain-containing protein [Alistipes sp.]